MDVFDHFAPATDSPSGLWGYYPLTGCKTIKGFTGTFFRLTCTGDNGEEISATCDNRYREHLRPYLDLLVKSQEGTSTEAPVVPLFHGDDGRWRFSWLGAQHDYPELHPHRTADSGTPSSPEGVATRLQVSVSQDLADRFKMRARANGMTHTDLLLELIRGSVT